MRKIYLFMMVSVDGFFEGRNHDISWHKTDEEFAQFAIDQANKNKVEMLLFGRRTYQLMESYWPTPDALRDDPVVAKMMNATPKIVFSRTLKKVVETEHWKNVSLKRGVNAEEIKKLKQNSTKDIAIFGSNNLCVSLMKKGLVDEFRLMINPIILGRGTLLFEGFDQKLDLKLTSTRTFKNGNVLLTYKTS